jgi:C4-dicarboxylate-specific signal transduction histidine kinase
LKHRLLLRQLSAFGFDENNLPAQIKDWQAFLARIERAYSDADQERYLLERSLHISSQEMQERWQLIEQERAKTAHSGKMASLGEMAGGIAHEINNPLAVIKTLAGQASEVLNDENSDKALVLGALKKIEGTVDRIAKIVHGLRTFSRDSSADPFVSSSLASIIEDTLVFCLERFRQHQVRLLYTPVDPALHIDCRPMQISQVLLNILNNAHDAIAEKEEKWIQLEIQDGESEIQIWVTDCGHGIAPEIQQKIFQPFFTTKTLGKGTGLGLSLALGILTAHGGALRVDPNCANTRFVIALPKKATKAAPEVA